MPSIVTHHLFAEEVYKNLSVKEKKYIGTEKIIFTTFAQSHDYLFYYTFDLKNAKWIKELGHHAHHNKTQAYILNILKEIKEKHLESNKQCVAYLYGVITHYVLDSTCHPFVFYKTGVYRQNDLASKKYRGEHTRMEKELDAIYYEKYFHHQYRYCNLNKEIIQKPHFTNQLNKLIETAYFKTYNKQNMGNYYQKSIRDAKIINTLFIHDFIGIKKYLYALIDWLFQKKFGTLQAYSTHHSHLDYSFLNEDHLTWNHPSIKSKTYNYSFPDLFNISLDKTLKIIKEINKVLFANGKIEDISKYIPDLDYSTGLIIENNLRMDYFEENN